MLFKKKKNMYRINKVDYSLLVNRRLSFLNEHWQSNIDDDDLDYFACLAALTGLYYSGVKDLTICHARGCCLSNWDNTDDPQEKHRKENPKCDIAFSNDYKKIFHLNFFMRISTLDFETFFDMLFDVVHSRILELDIDKMQIKRVFYLNKMYDLLSVEQFLHAYFELIRKEKLDFIRAKRQLMQ